MTLQCRLILNRLHELQMRSKAIEIYSHLQPLRYRTNQSSLMHTRHPHAKIVAKIFLLILAIVTHSPTNHPVVSLHSTIHGALQQLPDERSQQLSLAGVRRATMSRQ